MSTRHLALTLSLLGASALALIPSTASAQTQIGTSRRVGVGLALGYPNVGLGLNFFLAPRESLQIDVSWGWRNEGRGLFARADLAFYMPPVLAQGPAGALHWYLAPGAFLGFANGRYCRGSGACGDGVFYLGAELGVGLAWHFRSVPIDLTLEAVPRLGLLDHQGFGPWFDIGGAFHARYYF